MPVGSGSTAGLVQWTSARALEVGHSCGACGQGKPSSCVAFLHQDLSHAEQFCDSEAATGLVPVPQCQQSCNPAHNFSSCLKKMLWLGSAQRDRTAGGGRDLWGASSPTKAGLLRCPGSLQRWRLQHLCGQPVLGLHHPQLREAPPRV